VGVDTYPIDICRVLSADPTFENVTADTPGVAFDGRTVSAASSTDGEDPFATLKRHWV
jgi:hypothetical protein